MPKFRLLLAGAVALALGGCSSNMEFDQTGGIKTTRSACPAVAVPAYTGDVTLFNPPASREARALDVTATIVKVRGTCSDLGERLDAGATFEVQAQRRDTAGAREVVLPYFVTVMRGGTQIVAKRVGRVALRFEDGQARASTTAAGSSSIVRAEAMIPADVEEQINRRRKPGDADAAVDPMSDPAVRAAVNRASFELLVGFQLTSEQLAYNATR